MYNGSGWSEDLGEENQVALRSFYGIGCMEGDGYSLEMGEEFHALDDVSVSLYGIEMRTGEGFSAPFTLD